MGREHKGVDGLTGTQRAVLDMLSDKSVAEVAAIRGVGVASVQAVVRKLKKSGKFTPSVVAPLAERMVVGEEDYKGGSP